MPLINLVTGDVAEINWENVPRIPSGEIQVTKTT